MSRVRVIAVLAILVAGCAAPGASFLPSAASPDVPAAGSIPPTVVPAGPSQTPGPQAGPLYGSAIRPIVAELSVRAGPSTSSTKKTVVTPKNVLVVHGLQSLDADGYTWQEVSAISTTGELPALPELLPWPAAPIEGWIAVAKGGTAYVEQLAPRCPSTIDLRNIVAMLESERLACFGATTIVLEAVFVCGGCAGEAPVRAEPVWLADQSPRWGVLAVTPYREGSPGLVGHSPPGGPAHPPDSTIIRVRGHFDDVAARDCSIALPLPGDQSETPVLVPIDQATAEALCRQQFVVESYEILGTDPDAPTGQ